MGGVPNTEDAFFAEILDFVVKHTSGWLSGEEKYQIALKVQAAFYNQPRECAKRLPVEKQASRVENTIDYRSKIELMKVAFDICNSARSNLLGGLPVTAVTASAVIAAYDDLLKKIIE